jgi:hypothetical protein
MNKILQFPKSKSKKVETLKKSEARNFAVLVSLVSLILVAIFMNDNMTQSRREVYIVGNGNDLEKLNRAIASARPVTFYRDLEWEGKMVEKLNSGKDRFPASSAARVQLIDQLRFGELHGKYRLVQDDSSGPSLVKEIEYVESLDAGDQPIVLKNPLNFLDQYKEAFSPRFESVLLDQRQGDTEIYQLLGSNKKRVGNAAFKLDGSGRVLSIRLSSIDK